MTMVLELTETDRRFIAEAADYLERPRFLIRVASLAERPLERALGALPAPVRETVERASRSSISKALDLAIRGLPSERGEAGKSALRHLRLAALTGAVGGLFGAPGLLVELPVTTLVMLRSIASIAAGEGEDLSLEEARLECLLVFSLGKPGAPAGEDGSDAPGSHTTYYAARFGFAKLLSEALARAAARGSVGLGDLLGHGAAPVAGKLVARIAARFELVVTDKLLAQAVPLIGAASGAAINAVFADHFNTVARYHFGLRRLERERGAEAVRAEYERASMP